MGTESFYRNIFSHSFLPMQHLILNKIFGGRIIFVQILDICRLSSPMGSLTVTATVAAMLAVSLM